MAAKNGPRSRGVFRGPEVGIVMAAAEVTGLMVKYAEVEW